MNMVVLAASFISDSLGFVMPLSLRSRLPGPSHPKERRHQTLVHKLCREATQRLDWTSPSNREFGPAFSPRDPPSYRQVNTRSRRIFLWAALIHHCKLTYTKPVSQPKPNSIAAFCSDPGASHDLWCRTRGDRRLYSVKFLVCAVQAIAKCHEHDCPEDPGHGARLH